MSNDTILIVDDEVDLLNGLKRMIESQLRVRVLMADNGPNALDVIGDQSVDVVLTDIRMPTMDGITLLRKIQEYDKTITVIIMTAFGTIERAVAAIKAGAFDLIQKPFDEDRLIHLIKNGLERNRLVRENTRLMKALNEQTQTAKMVGRSRPMRELAASVGRRVIEKPKLTIWMILVPVIFVYFFYRLQKYSSGRKAFSDHFMVSRLRALEEAYSAVQSGKPPDSLKLCRISSVPEPIYNEYRVWLDVLIEHYMDLLNAEGGHITALIRAVYKNRANYLLFINQLNTVEREFNAALSPHLPENIEDGRQIMTLMETGSDDWRRQQADIIFADNREQSNPLKIIG